MMGAVTSMGAWGLERLTISPSWHASCFKAQQNPHLQVTLIRSSWVMYPLRIFPFVPLI